MVSSLQHKYSIVPELCNLVSIAGKLSLKVVPHLSSSIKNEEIQQILDYLGTIEILGEFELTIFAFTLTHCPYEMVCYRIRKLIEFVSTTEFSKNESYPI
ncbi:hypothetical protein ACJBYX_08830 [Streptococcus suis]|uniref:Rgg family transcriptional regulator n=1 Tax=Streptococcus suis TaxID=1307 RepID=UPI0005CF1768